MSPDYTDDDLKDHIFNHLQQILQGSKDIAVLTGDLTPLKHAVTLNDEM